MDNNFISLGLNLGHDAGISIIKSNSIELIEFEKITGVRHVCGGHTNIKQLFESILAPITENLLQNPIGVCDYVSPRALYAHTIDEFSRSASWECTSDVTSDHLTKKFTSFYELKSIKNSNLHVVRHHWAHALLSYYTSNFKESIILVLDGVGSFADCGLIAYGYKDNVKPIALLSNINGPRFGLIYESLSKIIFGSQFDTGKLLGLAAFGKPMYDVLDTLRILLVPNRMRKKNPQYYDTINENKLSNTALRVGKKWFKYDKLTGGYFEKECITYQDYLNNFGQNFPSAIKLNRYILEFDFDFKSQNCQDLAATLQMAFEIEFIQIAKALKKIFPQNKTLCYSGGCALNITANSKLIAEGIFDNVYIPSCCDDSGVSMGAAIAANPLARTQLYNNQEYRDQLSYSGKEFFNHNSIKINDFILKAIKSDNVDQLISLIAKKIHLGWTVGWINGTSETGPRALGRRSILGNPLIPGIRHLISEKIKNRESFRPLAVSCPIEMASKYFEGPIGNCNTMLYACQIRQEYYELFKEILHFDGSIRLQTVDKQIDPLFHKLLLNFRDLSDVPVIINTSLNINGMAIANDLNSILKILYDTPLSGITILENLTSYFKNSIYNI